MSITAQDVIDRAIERAELNDPNLIPDAESRAWITNFERYVFQIAAKENPDYFGREGKTSTRASSTDSWDISSSPGNVAAVSRIEVDTITGSVSGVSSGDRVWIVSIRDPDQGLAPRVYLRDRTVHEYNQELQDDSSNYVTKLKLYYSPISQRVTSNSQDLELPEEWEDLVALPLAREYARRDQRFDEAQLIQRQYQTIMQMFRQAVSVMDEGAERATVQVPAASVPMNFGGDGG